jgi:TRAP-type transport system periplasmic protein
MKKAGILAAKNALCYLILILAGLTLAAPALAKSIQLTYSIFLPPSHIQAQLAQAWCHEVEARTEGRVKIQFFPGQTLTKADQTYESVIDGIADIGFSVLGYTRGRFPVISAIDLPFGYPSGIVATAAANELYDKFQPAEFSDTQLMYLHAHGPGFIHTRGKTVRKLEDLKGLKVRSTGNSAQVIQALGGTPVPMSMPEAYQSLQKGVVDGSAHPLEANKGWKLGEVCDYAVSAYSASYTTAFFVVMNKNKWNQLERQDQETITAINRQWAVKHGEAWDISDMEGLRFFLHQGGTLTGLDVKESARWGTAVNPLIEAYAQKLNEKGLQGQEIILTIRQAMKNHTK